MKRFLIVFLLSLSVTACGRQSSGYVVGFYNLENLFDAVDEPGKNDAEFLPDGENQWTEERYRQKLHNMAYAIRRMGDANGGFLSVLGVAEVENARVLEDLVSSREISSARYSYVHFDSPDPRGIDVALLYRPSVFKLLESRRIPYTGGGTRDILMARGNIGSEMFAFYVAHLPSRLGGKSTDRRASGAELIYADALRLMGEYPGIKIVVMGDMNDDPDDWSMTDCLHARETIGETGAEDFFSPFMSMLKAGYGSLEYKGVWEIFDQILVNKALTEGPGLKVQPAEKGKYYARIFKEDFLVQQEGRYKGTPFRTFSNGKFINGYSDHFPTYIVLEK